MRLKLIIDMNQSPDWVDALASDYVVFAHDLDIGTMLALSHANGPSVFQLRTDHLVPAQLAPIVVAAIQQHEDDLMAGALVVVGEHRSRVCVLPI